MQYYEYLEKKKREQADSLMSSLECSMYIETEILDCGKVRKILHVFNMDNSTVNVFVQNALEDKKYKKQGIEICLDYHVDIFNPDDSEKIDMKPITTVRSSLSMEELATLFINFREGKVRSQFGASRKRR